MDHTFSLLLEKAQTVDTLVGIDVWLHTDDSKRLLVDAF